MTKSKMYTRAKTNRQSQRRHALGLPLVLAASIAVGGSGAIGFAQEVSEQPWLDATKTADERASLLTAALPQSKKIELIQGEDFGSTSGKLADLTAYGIPVLLEADAQLGIFNLRREGPGVVMPNLITTAATWNPELAFERGAVLGEEARSQGVGVLLYPAGNLVRDPRGGRTGDYMGEDPLLAGSLMAVSVRGVESRHILGDIKHLGIYGWESQRKTVDMRIEEAAARESDLLAFEIAIGRGKPASVMCAYSWFNGVPSCASKFLLTDVLRRDWNYKGFVVADWDAFQDTVTAANAGLDIQSAIVPTTNPKPNAGAKIQGGKFNDGRLTPPPGPFGPGGETPYYAQIQSSIDSGAVSQSTLDQMVHNILTGIFQTGIVEHPLVPGPLATSEHRAVAARQTEEGAVLLKNDHNVLPFAPGAKLALIGNVSQQNAARGTGPTLRDALSASSGDVSYENGNDVAAAVQLAQSVDVPIVTVRLGAYEGADLKSLALPARSEALIEAVAAANPKTVVIVYGTNPILMPWLNKVSGVLQVWDPGDNGNQAVGDLLVGKINPSGRLPLTYPNSAEQFPRQDIPGFNRGGLGGIYTEVTQVPLIEGANVGYKWFQAKETRPLFPFGFGLSYTQFTYGKFNVDVKSARWQAKVRLTNTGDRAGKEVVQIYGQPTEGVKRLAGFTKVNLQPGESRTVVVDLEPKTISTWSDEGHCWRLPSGGYRFEIGKDANTVLRSKTKNLSQANPSAIENVGGAAFCK